MLDAQFCASFGGVAHGLYAMLVTKDAVFALTVRPAAIPIHDHSNMLRKPFRIN